ncbi:CYFA0S34e00518g1_1 [Cyberlindnera fabianii]|uniref:Ribonuclease T2-like n=1 Tax=Cyberlindnera fabianii TaxID=36022 RepID=A0A061BE25_CYBFA|nr:CYFA0S34e00518g1_1 [Cyberlindnera fabianii]
MQRALILLASAIVGAKAFNLADAMTEGSCIVLSTKYPVISTGIHEVVQSSTPIGSSSSSSEASSVASSTESSYTIEPTSSYRSCPLDLPLSCSNTTSMDSLSCCFESPGGLVLQTQFWDYKPATGPEDAFTIHGLWPDNCDGSYDQYCDKSMEITNPKEIVGSYNEELLSYMETYWKDYKGDDESLWEHEFNKHGTCYSTLKPTCYGDNMTDHEYVYDYYRETVELYETLPTYQWLKDADIVPSTTATYSKDAFIAALSQKHGAIPYISCDSDNAISEVWYYFHIRGPLVGGEYVPTDSTTVSKSCKDGIKFPPKQKDTTPTTTQTSDGPQSTAPATKGYITLSGQDGCLIKNGHWYTTGTCATYSMIQLSTGSVYLKSSAGYCTIANKQFTCSSDVTSPFEFNYDSSANVFSANGVTTFSAAEAAKGQTQEVVSLGSGAIDFTLQFSPK